MRIALLSLALVLSSCGQKSSDIGKQAELPIEKLNENQNALPPINEVAPAAQAGADNYKTDKKREAPRTASAGERGTDRENQVVYDTLVAEGAGASTVGNGGDAIICFKPGTRVVASVELLDYYEANTRWNIDIDLVKKSAGLAYQKVRQVLERLSAYDPVRSKQLMEAAQKFDRNTHYIPGIRLANIQDSNHIGVPAGCEIAQIARQQAPTSTDDRLFIVAKDLYDLMDETNKAGLVLHEIIYREFITRGQTISTNARYFNSKISSNSLYQEVITRRHNLIYHYMETLRDTNLPYLVPRKDRYSDFPPIEIDMTRVASWAPNKENNRIDVINLKKGYRISHVSPAYNGALIGMTPKIEGKSYAGPYFYKFELGGQLRFDAKGTLANGLIYNLSIANLDPRVCSFKMTTEELDYQKRRSEEMGVAAHFYANGNFSRLFLDFQPFFLCTPELVGSYPMKEAVFSEEGQLRFFHYSELQLEGSTRLQGKTRYFGEFRTHLCNDTNVLIESIITSTIIGKICSKTYPSFADSETGGFQGHWAKVDKRELGESYTEEEAMEIMRKEIQSMNLPEYHWNLK